jgi:ABC-type glycerol-3-phosphate transport system permease component
MLVPLYWIVKTSISGESLYKFPPSIIPQNANIFYYVDAWYYTSFPTYFLNSLIVALMAIVANTVFNATAGYALTRQFAGKRLVMLLLLSCMMIPFQATIIPAFLLTKNLGLLDTYVGIALPLCATIVSIFVFKNAFEAVPRGILDAARMDGLPEWRMLPEILFPLAKPAIATNMIIAFIFAWNSFLWPLIIVRSPDLRTLPLGLNFFLSTWENVQGALFAFLVVALLPSIIVFLLLQREFIAGLTAGAVKG